MKTLRKYEGNKITWDKYTLHRGLSVVPKTDGEIYVSISIGEYIITFTCFLHCAKKGRVVENIESEVATWKIVIDKISTPKW